MQVLFSKIDSLQLFDPNLISHKLQQKLPAGFVLRPLHLKDFDKGSDFKSKLSTILYVFRIRVDTRTAECRRWIKQS